MVGYLFVAHVALFTASLFVLGKASGWMVWKSLFVALLFGVFLPIGLAMMPYLTPDASLFLSWAIQLLSVSQMIVLFALAMSIRAKIKETR